MRWAGWIQEEGEGLERAPDSGVGEEEEAAAEGKSASGSLERRSG